MTTATRTPRRNTVVTDDGRVTIPDTVVDLDSFRAWLDSGTVPEKAKTWFIDGEVWIDMSKEQIFTHVALKTEITSVLYSLTKANKTGRVLSDGVLVTNPAANLSGNPDAIFVAHETVTAGRVRLVPGKEGGFTEMDGAPDMVLEVVSDSSERKDNQTLLERYWTAGILEYWIVDARGDDLEFTIYRHGPKGYSAVRKQSGWAKSAAFGKSFKLTRVTDANGDPEFTLEVK
jgi:Uma2 family endonuclease